MAWSPTSKSTQPKELGQGVLGECGIYTRFLTIFRGFYDRYHGRARGSIELVNTHRIRICVCRIEACRIASWRVLMLSTAEQCFGGHALRHDLINAIVFISRAEVERITGMSRAWVYQAMAENRFPRPVACSSGSRRWILSEVQQWMLRRVQDRDEVAARKRRRLGEQGKLHSQAEACSH